MMKELVEKIKNTLVTAGSTFPADRKDARSMKIIKELTAEFQIELTAEIADTLFNHLRLKPEIFIVIKTVSDHM